MLQNTERRYEPDVSDISDSEVVEVAITSEKSTVLKLMQQNIHQFSKQ